MEWIGAALITIGILSFQYTQLQKQQNSHGGSEQGDSPYGLFLLGLSLFMDGLLGACQNALKLQDKKTSTAPTYRPPTAMETMLYINLYATMILLPASYYAGQFQNGMNLFLDANGDMAKLLLQLNLSASLGQVFIFLTIHHFSPLICTTITTTRKFLTILLSVYKFGHVLNVLQWGSVGLVFGGLYLEIAAKMVGQSVKTKKD
jgi:UDP-galactose transporter B1